MTSRIQEYPAARAALSVLKSLGRGFAVVAGGIFSAFFVVLRAGARSECSKPDDCQDDTKKFLGGSPHGDGRYGHEAVLNAHDTHNLHG